MITAADQKPVTVSEYLNALNASLREFHARIGGEISQLKHADSGHVYFSIKDKNDGSVLRCAMWQRTYAICGVELKEGLEVVVAGAANIYKPRGEFTFIARTVELAGAGAFERAYQELKKKLEDEGLFAEERKRPIPAFPRAIGVITSRGGEVIHDFEANLGKHGFKIKFVHSAVEGQEAALPLIRAIGMLKIKSLDALVVMRGGGSLESFQAFNNETVVRSIASFPAPVLTALGHHRDLPLAALVSDMNVSTPTAAAHALSRSSDELAHHLLRYKEHIVNRYAMEIALRRSEFERSFIAIPQRFQAILAGSAHILEVTSFAPQKFQILMDRARQTIDLLHRTIMLNNPERQFRLGFSITRQGGRVIKSVRTITKAEPLTTHFSDGVVGSAVKEINVKNVVPAKAGTQDVRSLGRAQG